MMLTNISILFISLGLLLFFPELPIFFFAPYLVFVALRNSIQNLLLKAMCLGCIVDLFSSQTFGFFIITYLLGACGISLHSRYLVFSRSSVMLLTTLFAIYASISQFILYSLKGSFFWLDPKYFFVEVFVCSIYDMIFAFALLFMHTLANRTKVKR